VHTLWDPILFIQLYKQYGIPQCAHSLNAPCLYIKNWLEDGSLELKHVAIYVLMIIYMSCLTE